MTRPEIRGLYVITPEATDTASLLAMTQQALAGGARLVQYRSKTDDAALRLEQARSLARLCAEFDVPFIINDYPDLALEVGADGVHLGKGDAPITEARRKLGLGKIIGISCYERLERAVEAALSQVEGTYGIAVVSTRDPERDLFHQHAHRFRVFVPAAWVRTAEQERMLRRAMLKAVAIPGYQVPFGSREMPLPYGWGTGGIQVTAALIGPDDVLKVIDQGSDDTTNAVNIRRFFERTTGVATTGRTRVSRARTVISTD